MGEGYCPEGMLDSYLYESFQLIEQMEEILSDQGNGFFDEESVREMFRILHTLKGSSAIMMYDNIAVAAHKLEDIFYYLRESSCEDIPKAELAAYIYPVSDFMAGELHKIREGKNADADPQPVIGKTEEYLERLKAEIREKGMELPSENRYEEPIRYYIAPAAEKETPIKIDLGDEPEPGDYIIEEKKPKREKLVGISLESLEKLTELVDRLERLEGSLDEEKCGRIKKKLWGTVAELKSTVCEMMQIPMEGTFRKMNRVVFDASGRLNKEIALKTEGGDTMIDRFMAEEIGDALMHLVRNAAVHGIESAKERLEAGKPLKGTITLSAGRKENILYLLVSDDGRGLDKEEILERAKQKRLVDRALPIETFSDSEIYAFITKAGFTTCDKVTELAGRGVGMDVVAEMLERSGGKLKIESRRGEGTAFAMEIPILF